ncbi:MAG: ABC transporter ATP-binding protein [Deinococcales bacterium]
MSASLEIRDLYVGYYHDLHILRGVHLDAREGAVTAILGANGTGKSTLLKSVFGLLRPERGSIRFGGRDLVGVAPHHMVHEGISYIPQDPGVFGHMTVEENLVMGAWPYRRDARRIRRKLRENYERFPVLAEKRRQNAGELSGGQKRMVEVGRALMTDPKLLLVDEPSAGLAKLLTEEMYRMLAGLRDEGIALLLVDQDIRQALGIADHVYVLDLGRNRFDAPAAEITDVEKVFWT